MHRYFYLTLVGVTLLTACSSEKAPSVYAGQDQAVLAGEVVNLSGRAKGAGEKSVQWQQIAGDPVEIDKSKRNQLTFTAPQVDTPQTLIFEFSAIKAGKKSSASLTDTVSIQINPQINASVVQQWNALALELIKRSERGPTISSRFTAYMNTALYSAWAAFDTQALGWLVNTNLADAHPSANSRATLQEYAMAKAAYVVFQEFTAGSTTILRQKYLEIDTGEDAEIFRQALLIDAEALFNATAEKAQLRLIGDSAGNLIQQVGSQANELAEQIILFAAADGAQAENDYEPASLTFETDPWALPRPERVQRNKINFYNQVEYTDAEGVLYPKYNFPEFDPAIAATRVGATWDENGRLTLNDPQNMVVNPAVQDGTIKLTSSWQSLTEWGIFPGVNDGGSQIPLTPHWGDVTPFTLPNGQYLRPDRILTPYEDNGELSADFIAETTQVVEFARTMIDRAEGGAMQRAQSEYWELGDNTPYPPGWWLDASLDLIAQGNIDLKTALTITMSLSQAVFDAGVASWDSKYYFNSVRPFTVVNQMFFGSEVPSFKGSVLAGTDDRDVWFPYQLRRNFTPPFPDIPSGHSSFSYAASTVLKEVFASNNFDYQSTDFNSRFDTTDGFNGDNTDGNELTNLSWMYLSLAAEEAGMSRLYGGIHMQEGNWIGLKFGIEIGHAALLKVEALMRGEVNSTPDASTAWFDHSPNLVFGTMRNDSLSDDQVMGDKGEIYGFYGDDILSTGVTMLASSIEMFGGIGQDSFILNGNAKLLIRDYESGETISIGSGAWDGSRQEPLTVAYPDDVTTQLKLGDITVTTLDGYWLLSELNVTGL
ncbi:MAG: phosphatase PAP2 family protein [Candidatus Azotimanducaceae bacterium]